MRNLNSILIFTGIVTAVVVAFFMITGCENGDPDTCNCTCVETEEIAEVVGETGEEVVEAIDVIEGEEVVETTEAEDATTDAEEGTSTDTSEEEVIDDGPAIEEEPEEADASEEPTE